MTDSKNLTILVPESYLLKVATLRRDIIEEQCLEAVEIHLGRVPNDNEVKRHLKLTRGTTKEISYTVIHWGGVKLLRLDWIGIGKEKEGKMCQIFDKTSYV